MTKTNPQIKYSISTKQVYDFIEDNLTRKIFDDLSDMTLKIVSEADLQSIVYYHLRKYLEKDSRWKIFNKQPIKRKGRGGIYPDLTLFRSFPKIAIELKEHSALNKKDVLHDAKKLESIMSEFKKGYVIYVTRKAGAKSDRLYGEANSWIKENTKDHGKHVTAIIVNAFDNMDTQTKMKYVKKRNKYSIWGKNKNNKDKSRRINL